MDRTEFRILFVFLLLIAGCCNALQQSRNLKIPPYVVEYYHYDKPDKPTDEEKESGGWGSYTWDNGFKMDFKIDRVEESGIYFYRMLCRAHNTLQDKIVLGDRSFELLDSTTSAAIERVECWNWQKVNYPCNVATVEARGEMVKEIRFGYSIDEGFARGLRILINNLDFAESGVMIDFYARRGPSK